MSSSAIEIAVFVVVFLAVWTIFGMGGGKESPARPKRGEPYELATYRPSVKTLFEYRNENGVTRRMPVRISKSLCYPGGQVHLRGFCGKIGGTPKNLRIDRVVAVTTPNGELLDKRLFFTEQLHIPTHLLPEDGLAYPLAPAA